MALLCILPHNGTHKLLFDHIVSSKQCYVSPFEQEWTITLPKESCQV